MSVVIHILDYSLKNVNGFSLKHIEKEKGEEECYTKRLKIFAILKESVSHIWKKVAELETVRLEAGKNLILELIV